MSAIELSHVAKSYGATPVLADVELTIPERSTTVVLGPSGSGKTTLLKLIAGLELVDAGTIRIGGELVDDGRRSVKAQRRGVGYVPQDGALFPHLTVSGNVAFGLARPDRAAVDRLLDLVGLARLRRRYPHQLSGGQQQRVALARALAIRPNVVLLDEPFKSLDATMRSELRRDVGRVLRETGSTTVLVTHDQEEALSLADQIALLHDGAMSAVGGPRELYGSPPDVSAASSLGEVNVIPARVEGGRARCLLGAVELRDRGRAGPEGPADLLLRPEQLLLHDRPRDGTVRAEVIDLQYFGHDALALVRVGEAERQTLTARVPGGQALAAGQDVWVEVVGAGLTRAGPTGA